MIRYSTTKSQQVKAQKIIVGKLNKKFKEERT